MNDLDTNSLIWRMFVSATLDAAVCLGTIFFGESTFYQKSGTTNDKDIVRRVKKVDHRSDRDSRSVKKWLARTPLAKDNYVERLSSLALDSKSSCVLRAVLCLGKMHQHTEAIDAWKKKVEWFTATPQYRELDRIDGDLMVPRTQTSSSSKRCSISRRV